MKKPNKKGKNTGQIHRLLALLPAMEFNLRRAEILRKEIAKIKVYDLRK